MFVLFEASSFQCFFGFWIWLRWGWDRDWRAKVIVDVLVFLYPESSEMFHVGKMIIGCRQPFDGGANDRFHHLFLAQMEPSVQMFLDARLHS